MAVKLIREEIERNPSIREEALADDDLKAVVRFIDQSFPKSNFSRSALPAQLIWQR